MIGILDISTNTKREIGYTLYEKLIIQVAAVWSCASMEKLVSSVTTIEVLGDSPSFLAEKLFKMYQVNRSYNLLLRALGRYLNIE